LHNIFNHDVTKSKQCYIKSMAQHKMLSYYRDCVFVSVKVEMLHHGVLFAAHYVEHRGLEFSQSEILIEFFFNIFIYCNRSLVKAGMLLMRVVLDGWPSFKVTLNCFSFLTVAELHCLGRLPCA
jgi:hypothetical protein